MAALDGSFVVIVSPLIAIINNQIEAFSAKGLKAVHYHAQYGVAMRGIQIQSYTRMRQRLSMSCDCG